MRGWAECVMSDADSCSYRERIVAQYILDTVPEPVDPIQAALLAWNRGPRCADGLENMRVAIAAYEKAKEEQDG
jgi:hypothetical protein